MFWANSRKSLYYDRQNRLRLFPKWSCLIVLDTDSVVEQEPELEPQGDGIFGRSRSWSRYSEVSAPAPGSGSRSNWSSVFNHNSYWIGSKNWIKWIFFTKSHEKSTSSFKSCENRYPKSLSRSRSRLRSRSGNILKVGAGARAGAEANSFGSATLDAE
jgi:hypothetical protein